MFLRHVRFPHVRLQRTLVRIAAPCLLAAAHLPAMAQPLTDFRSVEGVDALAAGSLHTCVLIDGEAWCTGVNESRQLGRDDVAGSPTPLRVAGLPATQQAIAAGARHTCTLDTAGSVRCWGDNTAGQLGQGTASPHAPPGVVPGLVATQVSPGARHTCAIAGGTARCWGDNTTGQLGHGGASTASPTDVAGLPSNVVAIAAGHDHGCAVLADGSVRCWGAGDRGQLGHGLFAGSTTPVTVAGLSDATAVVAGDGYTCALRGTGGVACWGRGDDGINGGDGSGDIASPMAVPDLDQPATAISASNAHTCALMQDATARCWGSAWSFELGTTRPPQNALRPVQVMDSGNVPLADATAIVAGGQHSCAIVDGRVRCWGLNTEGQRGYGRSFRRRDPVQPVDLGTNVLAVDSSDASACAVRAPGHVLCWGRVAWGFITPPPLTGTTWSPLRLPGIDDARAVSLGGDHGCLVDAGGGARCWGINVQGALGDGTVATRLTPQPVVGLSQDVREVSARGRLNCALRESGTVACWGTGALGNGVTGLSLVPVEVTGLADAQRIGTGADFACALRDAGGVVCWGMNTDGQLGDGTTTSSATPVAVSGIADAIDLSVNLLHACALLPDNDVRCWGYNSHGQLGDGSFESRAVPVAVQGLVGEIASLHAGALDTCAIDTAGGMQCWGDNFGGHLGDGTRTNRSTPVPSTAVREPMATWSSGSWFSCGLTVTGAARCWGENRQGQLGNDGYAPLSFGSFTTMSHDIGPLRIFRDAFE